MSAAVVCGIGTCLPERVVSNDDLAARLDTSDAWIRFPNRHRTAPDRGAGHQYR